MSKYPPNVPKQDPPLPLCPKCRKLSTAVAGDAFLGTPRCDGRCPEPVIGPCPLPATEAPTNE